MRNARQGRIYNFAFAVKTKTGYRVLTYRNYGSLSKEIGVRKALGVVQRLSLLLCSQFAAYAQQRLKFHQNIYKSSVYQEILKVKEKKRTLLETLSNTNEIRVPYDTSYGHSKLTIFNVAIDVSFAGIEERLTKVCIGWRKCMENAKIEINYR